MIPTLDTPRLRLRPFALSDANKVQILAGDFAVADTTLAIPHPYQDGMAEAWISSHEAEFSEKSGATFAIEEKGERSLVGAISLMRIQHGHQAELGYWIGKPFWNRGYCTEAAREVLRYSFDELGLVRIHARHLSRNPASGRVMKKVGMLHEGRLRQHVKKWDTFENINIYGILLAEWAEAKH